MQQALGHMEFLCELRERARVRKAGSLAIACRFAGIAFVNGPATSASEIV